MKKFEVIAETRAHADWVPSSEKIRQKGRYAERIFVFRYAQTLPKYIQSAVQAAGYESRLLKAKYQRYSIWGFFPLKCKRTRVPIINPAPGAPKFVLVPAERLEDVTRDGYLGDRWLFITNSQGRRLRPAEGETYPLINVRGYVWEIKPLVNGFYAVPKKVRGWLVKVV